MGKAVAFDSSDGFSLAGRIYTGDGSGPLVLISSATAVPQQYYAGFARHLIERGARAVLTYDYRGVGQSTKRPEWKERINYRDWALQDFPAATAFIKHFAPNHELVGVGQSFGGQALGLSGAGMEFSRYLMVASMSGALRLLDDRWAWARMNLLGVPISMILNTMPRWVGGEPIPGSVFRDWSRWCRMRNFFFDDPELPEISRFEDISIPILAVGLTDDPWATKRAVDHFLSRHTNADIEQRWFSPGDAGNQPIGHLGFFRSRFAEKLWPEVTQWLLGENKRAQLETR